MKKNKPKLSKKKKLYALGCVVLAILLTISTYISIVVVGVVADEGKKGTLIGFKKDDTEVTEPNYNFDNNQQNNNQQNNNYVNDYIINYPVGNTDVNNADNGAQNVNTQLGANQTSGEPINTLLNENKTKADIVKIYADLMNGAKTRAPAFTKIEYQELPGDPANRVMSEGSAEAGEQAVNKMLDFLNDRGVFIPKEEAEANPYIHEKGDVDMARFPVFDREKGSYLTDPNGIDSYTYKVLSNGNVKMSFILVDEDNPEPISENSNIAPSYTGAVFSPMSKAKIDGTVYHPIVTVFAKDITYSLRYHDCSVEVEFNPNTLEIVYLEQIARVSIKGSGNVVGLGKLGLERQELIGYVIVKDFRY